jgi:hypothetical protein
MMDNCTTSFPLCFSLKGEGVGWVDGFEWDWSHGPGYLESVFVHIPRVF